MSGRNIIGDLLWALADTVLETDMPHDLPPISWRTRAPVECFSPSAQALGSEGQWYKFWSASQAKRTWRPVSEGRRRGWVSAQAESEFALLLPLVFSYFLGIGWCQPHTEEVTCFILFRNSPVLPFTLTKQLPGTASYRHRNQVLPVSGLLQSSWHIKLTILNVNYILIKKVISTWDNAKFHTVINLYIAYE